MTTYRDGNKSAIKGKQAQPRIVQQHNPPTLRVCFIGEADNNLAQPIKILSDLNCVIKRYGTKNEGLNALLTTDFDVAVTRLRDQQGITEAFEFIRLLRHCGHPEKSKLPVGILAESRHIAVASKSVAANAGNSGFLVALDQDLKAHLEQTVRALKNVGASSLEKASRFRHPPDVASAKNSLDLPFQRTPLQPVTQPLIAALKEGARDSLVAGKRLDMDQKKPLNTAAQQACSVQPNAKKGLFERLSEMVLARLAKRSATAGRPKSLPASARPRSQPDIDRESYDNVVIDMKRKSQLDDQKTVPFSAIPRQLTPRANDPVKVVGTKAQPSATRQNAPAPQPALQPRRTIDALPAAQSPAPPPIKDRVVGPSARLSEAEKNKAYERVRKLVSTAKQAPESVEGSPAKGKKLSICFLEDSHSSSQAIGEALAEYGHTVEHFSSAEEALDALLERHYDVVLASQIVALGSMDCGRLIRTIRRVKQPSKGQIPIVVLTTNSDHNNIQDCLHAGASDVIVKPITAAALSERIAKVADAPKRPQSARRLQICFLEDSCTSSQAIREMLGEKNHLVDHFSSAEEALDAILEKHYDILLTSQIVALGGMDCVGLIQALRQSPQASKRSLPIVALTANPNQRDHFGLFNAGAQDVVVKPVNGEALNERLQEAVNATPQPAEIPNQLRICFLEDSGASSQEIGEMLSDGGHQVDHFSSAEEALDAVLGKDYDVLLASQISTLRGLDTEGLVKTIRELDHPSKAHLPVVILTANSVSSNMEMLYDVGANEVAIKPLQEDLNELIAHTVQRDAGRARPNLKAASEPQAPPLRPAQPRPAAVPPARAGSPKPAPQHQPSPKANPELRPPSGVAKQVPKPPTMSLESFEMPMDDARLRAPAPPRRRIGTLLKVLAAMLVLAAIGFGIWKYYPIGRAIPVQMVVVEQGSLYKAINTPGRVVSKKRVEVTSSMSGQIVHVSAKEGDMVKKGQVLARLDSRAGDIQLEQANAKLDSAKKEVALAERTADRLARALQMGAVSRQMAEDAEATVHAAQARQRVASEELRAAKLSLERLDIVAPFDGVVTSAYAVDGLYAEPSGPLFTVVDMTEREVEVRIDSADTASISEGQTVMVSSDAFPDTKWSEKILRVAPAANRDNATANTVSVYISLGADAPSNLRFAQQIDVEIPTAFRERAIKLPFNAVTTRDGRTMVAVVDQGRAEYRPVTTGIEDLTHVEITGGDLKLGQKVILLNQDIDEGQQVEPVVRK